MEKQEENEKKIVDTIIKRVADGVWLRRDTAFGYSARCAFCLVLSYNDHDKDCPVVLARQLLALK